MTPENWFWLSFGLLLALALLAIAYVVMTVLILRAVRRADSFEISRAPNGMLAFSGGIRTPFGANLSQEVERREGADILAIQSGKV